MTETASPASDADSRARALIEQAFEDARRTGRPDWHTMTIAVLKNRILTRNRSFQERDYGARTIAGFVRRYPDLLLLDVRVLRRRLVFAHQVAAYPQLRKLSTAASVRTSGAR